MVKVKLSNWSIFFISILIISSIKVLEAQTENGLMNPPKAEKIKKELIKDGHSRIDNYYWLNERENPKVIEYLEAENRYTKEVMKNTEPLQQKLYDEIVGRIKQTDESVPYKDNGYYYYTRYEEGQEYPVYCRKKESLDADEEILLNVNEMAKGYEYYQVTGLSVSPDNNYLAYGVDILSRRVYNIYIKDLRTGNILPDKLTGTSGSAAWANDNRSVFYTIKDAALRPYLVRKHIVGSDYNSDPEVYVEKDPIYFTRVYKTKSDKYIVIASFSTLTSEYKVLDADNPVGEFKIIQPREKELEYYITHYGDYFYIHTNLPDSQTGVKAKNFKLMKTPVDKTTKENWIEVIPHRDDVLIEGMELFKNFFVVQERKNGLTQLSIIKWEDNTQHYLDFGEATYMANISINPEFDTELLRYSYSSLTTPSSVYDYNMRTSEKILLKQDEVVGGYNPQEYFAERLYATADDGTKIPISLVYKKGLVKNGTYPVLLTGYGAYGISTDPYFNSMRLSIIDRGFVYAIAHIRGGQEMGRQWYEDGKFLKKKNTFTDFIACAEHLINEKFTGKDKMFAMGGSAGGLLIGAVTNMRPDLFKGVIASVPFVDVVTTMLDESIPLTTGEYEEWGNPNDEKYYKYILSYSPYDNVEAKDYPNILVSAGFHDSQVQYWEPAKWVAKLRELKTDNNLLLLNTEMEYGHSGASGRFKKYKEVALEYAFLLKLLGINL
ncbi:MAG: S9 family peptidase [Ignavibacteriaceae bacterium]